CMPRAPSWTGVLAVGFAAVTWACSRPAAPERAESPAQARDAAAPASAASESAQPSASPTGLSVRISGVTRHAMHTHGGAPAHVTEAAFVVDTDDAIEHRITLDGVDFLSDHGVQPCDGPASTFAKALAPRGLRFDDASSYDLTPALLIPARSKRTLVTA